MSTMAETLDAPMPDSGDIDISMYSGMATTTDSWLSVEASMGDDGFAADAATFHYEQGGIEIEMGDDDDEPITEYEMADEGAVYDGPEIQDIEVYDISQVASPLPVDDHDFASVTHVHVEDAEIMHIPSSDGPALVPLLDPHTTFVEVPAESDVIAVVESTLPSGHVDATVLVDHGSLVAHGSDATPPTAALPETRAVDDASAPVDGGVPVAEPSVTTFGHLEPVEVAGPQDAAGQQIVDDVFLLQHDHSAHSDAVHHDDHGADHLVAAEDQDPGTYAVDESANADALDGNDPHEISDGVYIDPPPAVLLSLPPCAESGECCLFNFPASSTRQSPSSSAQPDTGHALRLLLQERPTLYYEPLSAVFTALRQEQCIHSMPDFAEAELVLDAYDLQLSISEDNVYTHEVTLHELNVIHDGSDLGGPLRLRLKVFAPRFVMRYNMLRDQVSRLNIGEEGGTHAEASTTEQYEQGYVEHDVQQVAEAAEQYHYEGDVSQEPLPEYNEERADGAVHEPKEDAAAEDAEQEYSATATGDEANGEIGGPLQEGHRTAAVRSVVTDVDPTLQATQLEAAERKAVEDGSVSADADADEEGEIGTYDADEVHEHATAEEGGDYSEHAEYPDDDDEFGEDLPEEVGGMTKDVAYPHIGATDDQLELPQDENDFERDVPTGVVGEHEGHQFNDTGLHTNPYTDAHEQPNSTDVPETGVEDPLHPTSEAYTEEDILRNLETDNAGLERTNALLEEEEEEEDGLYDNWDEADTLSSLDNARPEQTTNTLSRKSSTATLASAVSKRAYEEVDLDDFDDDDFDTAASSPSAKRLRTQ